MSAQSQHADQAAVPKKVAVFTAHPDDAEIVCGGTVARWVAEGHHVTLVLLTSGGNGSSDPEMTSERLTEIREKEQLAASAVLGIKETCFLRYQDGTLVPDLALRRHLTKVIREIKPNIVICLDPTVRWHSPGYINHPDHRAAGEATLDAIYPTARDRLAFPELLAEGLEPHNVEEVYIASANTPDLAIDITDYMDQKIASLKEHASQMGGWEPETFLREWGRETASRFPKAGEYAESFKYLKIE